MLVHRIKFTPVFKTDNKIAINVRLLGPEPEKTAEPTLEELIQDLPLDHLDEQELAGLRELVKVLLQAAGDSPDDCTTDDDMLLE